MANNIAGALLGPPAIWSRPWKVPERSELAGHYTESQRQLDNNNPPASASLTLQPDGSMVVANLPSDFGTSSCILSGKGSWGGPYEDGIHLTVISTQPPGTCQPGSYAGLQLAGHSAPYRLYWVVGDPDSGTGLWFQRR